MGRGSSRRNASPDGPPSFSTAKIVLIGGGALLLGIGGMLALRFRQLDDQGTGEADDSSTIVDSDDQGDTNSENTGTSEGSAGQALAESGNGDSGKGTGETASQSTGLDGVTDELDSDRGRKIMANMADVAISIAEFPQDSRGEITEVVQTAIQAQLEKCRLTYRAGDSEPIMRVSLDVRGPSDNAQLWMSVDLMAKDSSIVRVWARSGSVAPISNQALTTGIIPSNLERDVANFFRSLRGDFIDARRQFGS